MASDSFTENYQKYSWRRCFTEQILIKKKKWKIMNSAEMYVLDDMRFVFGQSILFDDS